MSGFALRPGDGIAIESNGIGISITNTNRPLIPGKITAVGTPITYTSVTPSLTVTPYSWVELTPDKNGVGYVTKTGGIVGTTSPLKNPLFEINDELLAVDDFVWVRERAFYQEASNQVVYECVRGGRRVTPVTAVTSVQCTGNNLVVTYDDVAGVT